MLTPLLGRPDDSRVSVISPSTPLRTPRRQSNSSRVQTLTAVESAWTTPVADQTTVVAVAAAVVVSAAVEVAVEVAVASVTAADVAASADVAADVADSVTAVAVVAVVEAPHSKARRSHSRRTLVRPQSRRSAASLPSRKRRVSRSTRPRRKRVAAQVGPEGSWHFRGLCGLSASIPVGLFMTCGLVPDLWAVVFLNTLKTLSVSALCSWEHHLGDEFPA